MSDEKDTSKQQSEKETPPPRPTQGKDLNSENSRPKIRNEKE
jgi:hypothetical protein